MSEKGDQVWAKENSVKTFLKIEYDRIRLISPGKSTHARQTDIGITFHTFAKFVSNNTFNVFPVSKHYVFVSLPLAHRVYAFLFCKFHIENKMMFYSTVINKLSLIIAR